MAIPPWQDRDAEEPPPADESLDRWVQELLEPVEYLLWTDRPRRPEAPRIAAVPAVFAGAIAGLSGFALAALFGLVGHEEPEGGSWFITLGLAPTVLGSMLTAHLIAKWLRHWRKCQKLAELWYAVTDQRAIIARLDSRLGSLQAQSIRPDMITDVCRFENPDGSGDLHFLDEGEDRWLPVGFFEVSRVDRVEALVREALLDSESTWRRSGVPDEW